MIRNRSAVDDMDTGKKRTPSGQMENPRSGQMKGQIRPGRSKQGLETGTKGN